MCGNSGDFWDRDESARGAGGGKLEGKGHGSIHKQRTCFVRSNDHREICQLHLRRYEHMKGRKLPLHLFFRLRPENCTIWNLTNFFMKDAMLYFKSHDIPKKMWLLMKLFL